MITRSLVCGKVGSRYVRLVSIALLTLVKVRE